MKSSVLSYWTCSCGTDNDQNADACSKCKKGSPAYANLVFDIPDITLRTDTEISIWHLGLAYHYLQELQQDVRKAIKLVKEFGMKDGRTKKKLEQVKKSSSYIKDHIEEVRLLDAGAKMDTADGVASLRSIDSMHSALLGELEFHAGYYLEAITYMQKSFEAIPNQEALYFMARSVSEVDPLKSSQVFGGNIMSQKARDQKKAIERRLFFQTLLFDPHSQIGISVARLLAEKYEIKIKPKEFKQEVFGLQEM
ncbi:MAG: hypothetical protein AAF242_07830 [Bacteroidota bacterium]